MSNRLIAGAGLFLALLPASALAAAPDPTPPTRLTITPSVTCEKGWSSEFIRLSRAGGDAIDGVFAFCRDPALSSAAWIARLESSRDRLAAGAGSDEAKAAIRTAFDRHIEAERAAN